MNTPPSLWTKLLLMELGAPGYNVFEAFIIEDQVVLR
jgi:hypothetical protein